MTEDFNERSDSPDALMRRLTAIVVKMDETIDELKVFNAQQVEINADIKTTLARVETLLSRMLRADDNGRDA